MIFDDIDFIDGDGRGADVLPEFLKHSPDAVLLEKAILAEIQELHDAQKEVYENINLFDAVGSQLDDIFGEILDLPRESGLTDEDYRYLLFTQVSRIAKSGEIPVMKTAYRSLLKAESVRLFEYQPAHFKLEASVTEIPADERLVAIKKAIKTIKQAGNGIEFSINDSEPFRLVASNPSQGSPNGLTDGTFTGGTLSTAF